MKKWILFSSLAILLSLPSCTSTATPEPRPTLENPFLEEELAAQAIATARAEKTQTAARVFPYAELSNGRQTYLAFWFIWNNETVFLPIAESKITEASLLSCQLNSDSEIAIGTLFSGFEFIEGECLPDKQALENALPIIKIPGYFEDGIETENLNVIDLHGEYAENLADIVTFIIENDLLGSGDLTLSIHRTDGPGGKPSGEIGIVPTYTLPMEALQITFSSDQLNEFEIAGDVHYFLKRKFTWKISTRYNDLSLRQGDENWFVLVINEVGKEAGKAYLLVKGVGILATP